MSLIFSVSILLFFLMSLPSNGTTTQKGGTDAHHREIY